MSRVRNADESLLKFRAAYGDYENRYRPLIDRVRAKYTNNPIGQVPPAIDESLEVHSRVYLVNALLNALNWRLDCSLEEGLPNLMHETPVTSAERGTRRFLDYLGLERNTNRPLLIVETKRPNSSFPQKSKPVPESECDSLALVVCDGLRGADLKGEWNEWLDDLRDYVRSVKEQTGYVPLRVVITNGDWLILFIDPADAFLSDDTPEPAKVLIWENRKDIEGRYAELFQWLEHCSVLRKTPPLTSGELLFHVEPNVVSGAMHGMRLLYIEEPNFDYEPSPMIKVLSVIFLRSRYGAWICVERQGESHVYRLPHRYEDLPEHLKVVRVSAESLLRQVEEYLGIELAVLPLTDHYYNHQSLADLRGVTEIGYRSEDRSTEYRLVLGANTHYILPEPSVMGCPYHDWFESQKESVESNPGPVTRRSVHKPRSFFRSGEFHHCAHCEVADSKASQITPENRERCGPRSGQDGQAFCEIFRFEEYLCCHTCAFEKVCTKTEVLRLPCNHLDI